MMPHPVRRARPNHGLSVAGKQALALVEFWQGGERSGGLATSGCAARGLLRARASAARSREGVA